MDSNLNANSTPEKLEKPFRLVKYFSFTSIIIILGLTLGLTFFLSFQARRMVLEQASGYNMMLAEQLNYHIVADFIIPAYDEFGEIRLRNPAQARLLDRVMLRSTHGFEVKQVIIYDLFGLVMYATDPETPFIVTSGLGLFWKARDGETADNSKAHESWRNMFSLAKPKQVLLRTFKPLKPTTLNYDKFRPIRPPIFNSAGPNAFSQTPYSYFYSYNNPAGEPGPAGIGQTPWFESLRRTSAYLGDDQPKRDWPDAPPNALFGILEVTQDLSPEYQRISRFQNLALGISLLGAVIVYFLLRQVVARGEKILQKQNQERQALLENLGNAQRLAGLGRMVATVAHEIRNPLGIISSTAEFLRGRLKTPEENRLAQVVIEESERLTEVVSDFLNFARPQEPHPQPCLVEDILEENLAAMEASLARSGIEVRRSWLEPPQAIMGDAKMLYRVFVNLLANAAQAMPEGGLLTVSTGRPKAPWAGKYLEITISDTGPGLHPEAQAKLFTPFFTTKTKGTGLGLVIVRNIVESHQGRITLVSAENQDEDEGPGTKALILLPLAFSQKRADFKPNGLARPAAND